MLQPRRSSQFTLRALFGVTTLVAIVLALGRLHILLASMAAPLALWAVLERAARPHAPRRALHVRVFARVLLAVSCCALVIHLCVVSSVEPTTACFGGDEHWRAATDPFMDVAPILVGGLSGLCLAIVSGPLKPLG